MFPYILKSLRHYWRTHLAVLAGVFVASTVLTGALFVGNSVKASLKQLIEERSGGIQAVLDMGGPRVQHQNHQRICSKLQGAVQDLG